MLRSEVQLAAEVEDDTRTVRVSFVGAPDEQERHHGRGFIVERGRVVTSHDLGGRRTYVLLEGRAIRKDGTIGKARRFHAYNLTNANWLERAPEWVRKALHDAGVTW